MDIAQRNYQDAKNKAFLPVAKRFASNAIISTKKQPQIHVLKDKELKIVVKKSSSEKSAASAVMEHTGRPLVNA